MKNIKKNLLPFILTLFVIAADQISKSLIVKFVPLNTIGARVIGDFFRIVHVSNIGVAFSFGATWSDTARRLAFALLPLVVIALVIVIYFRNDTFTKLQRWAICGIIGGGLGNLIDRFFRAEGVVDFLDFKFYGIFGFERWPTFNVADSAVVICGIMLIISFIVTTIKEEKAKKSENN